MDQRKHLPPLNKKKLPQNKTKSQKYLRFHSGININLKATYNSSDKFSIGLLFSPIIIKESPFLFFLLLFDLAFSLIRIILVFNFHDSFNMNFTKIEIILELHNVRFNRLSLILNFYLNIKNLEFYWRSTQRKKLELNFIIKFLNSFIELLLLCFLPLLLSLTVL